MRIFLFFILVLLAGCHRPEMVAKTECQKLTDSVQVLMAKDELNKSTIVALRDSIADLKLRPVMTSDQFIQLYKFGRLNKYYQICKKNPTQWKYYKGWSTRVFEQ
jgi:hypothetical protein